MVGIIRRVMEAAEFLDIQTPLLFKPTPEGARDFVVPSRLQKGRFYALPQSPQILKQLLVIAGFDRYYQIAICFRDEDLRADRVQEITQLDVEMAFPDLELIVALMEQMCTEVWRECIGVELTPPFRRLTYAESMARYGTDKPDLRFGLEIEDATGPTRGSGFKVFADAPCVRYLTVPRELSRAELAALEDAREGVGCEGTRLPRPRRGRRGALADREVPVRARSWPRSAPSRARRVLFGAGEAAARRPRARRAPQPPRRDARADRPGCRRVRLDHRLPDVRVVGGRRPLGAPSTTPSRARRPGGRSGSTPIPSTRSRSPTTWSRTATRSAAGSFRIHEPELQARVFDVLALTPEEQRAKFGFLLDALGMGAPPHGGIAFGIDRMVMVLAREANLRDTIAFPKNQAGIDPMSGAPTEVPPDQLAELGIDVVVPEEER